MERKQVKEEESQFRTTFAGACAPSVRTDLDLEGLASLPVLAKFLES